MPMQLSKENLKNILPSTLNIDQPTINPDGPCQATWNRIRQNNRKSEPKIYWIFEAVGIPTKDAITIRLSLEPRLILISYICKKNLKKNLFYLNIKRRVIQVYTTYTASWGSIQSRTQIKSIHQLINRRDSMTFYTRHPIS